MIAAFTRFVLVITALATFAFVSAASTVTLIGERIRVTVSTGEHNTQETVQFRDQDSWKTSLQTQGAIVHVRGIGGAPAACEVNNVARAGPAIIIHGACGSAAFERKLEPGPDPDLIAVTVRFKRDPAVPLLSVEDQLTFAPVARATDTPTQGPLDFVWSQNIKAAPENVIAHWQFKSPAVMLQQGDVFAALVPRIDLLTADTLRNAPTALDLSVPSGGSSWFSYGAVANKPSGHSYFLRVNDVPLNNSNSAIEYSYWIVTSPQSPRLGYQRVTHLLWEKFGSPNLKNTIDLQRNVNRPDLFLFDEWRHEAWGRYVEEKFWDRPCGAGLRCGGISSNRNLVGHWSDEPKQDAWFNSWFQTLRSAYGWFLYARRENNAALQKKAEEVLNLALSSPQQNGMFSTVYNADTNSWSPDDGWAGFSTDYHTFCMSWTGYWMLRWATDLVPDRNQEVLSFLKPYADFLISVQQPSGIIPSWLHPDGTPRPEFRDFNAETAGSALFLAEFSAFSHDNKYLEAAVRAQRFITENVLPRERWYDFETFISCARKPFSFFDRWTAQYPQNNLSTIQAAKAYLRIYELTKDPAYLDAGRKVLDYLLLTQQVWNHPLLSPKLVGGTTTQNTDAEWSDARECYVAILLFDYYQHTGNLDYLERSVAAARSGFAVAPWENWAHTGYVNEHGAMTGFHWGTGSEMTSVEMLSGVLGDVFVNAKLGHGVGFNACTLSQVSVKADRIQLDVKTEGGPRALRVRFSGLDPQVTYTVTINGQRLAPTAGKELLVSGAYLPPSGSR